MTLGPGKYDKLATWARERVGADAVALIVIHGDKGHGASVQIRKSYPPESRKELVAIMRVLLDNLEEDIRQHYEPSRN